MKKALLFSLMIIFISSVSAQEKYKKLGNYYYNKKAIIFDSIKLQVNDTLFLGFGSGANKNFVFITYRPNVLTYDVSKGPEPISPRFANGFLVLKEIKTGKAFGREYFDAIFYANGFKLKISVDLQNAYQSGEVKRFSSEKIDPSTIETM